MPIKRSYMCADCGHYLEVMLRLDQADEPAPVCPRCQSFKGNEHPMAQDFKPVAIGGSVRSKAEKITEDILANDYHVADLQRDHRAESTPSKVRYRAPASDRSTWGIAREALEGAVSAGRQMRQRHGSGLDVLQSALKSGAQPDLIELSKHRAMRIY